MTRKNPVMAKVAVSAPNGTATFRPSSNADTRKALEKMGVKLLSKM